MAARVVSEGDVTLDLLRAMVRLGELEGRVGFVRHVVREALSGSPTRDELVRLLVALG